MGMEPMKAELEKRSREMGPESLKGLLQCGALGSTELERSRWKIRALKKSDKNRTQIPPPPPPPLEKEIETHSSILAWRIPGTGAW